MIPDAELDRLFPLGPDSLPQPNVPAGRLEKYTFAESRVFPGTVRDYWIYLPAQYDAAQPAAVMIVQDGWDHIRSERRWRMPVIFDNLIHERAIPVSIGIFINPGVIPATRTGAPDRLQRSFEYDTPDDRYARFLIEEIIPAVAARYALRTDPDSRMLLGGSSGAFCAFNAAWHRPDAFRRVFSCVGSYVGLRGGHHAAPLVRLTEPKPLRLFLEGGAEDLNYYAGDWWTANTDMLSALGYAGYEVNHAWAPQAGHNDYHGSSIFPAALRWLWENYPQPIRAGLGSRQPIVSLTTPDTGWQCVHPGPTAVNRLAASPAGDLCFTQANDPALYRLTTAGPRVFSTDASAPLSTFAFSPDGRLYLAQAQANRILILDAARSRCGVIDHFAAVSLCVASNGDLYAVEAHTAKIWLIKADGQRHAFAHAGLQPQCLALTADDTQLIVGDAAAPVAWQWSVQPDGTLAHPEPCYRFDQADGTAQRRARGLAVHPKRWSFFATGTDLQLAEHDGRIVGIFASPVPGSIDDVTLSGPTHDALYVLCGGKIYRRPLRNPEHLWQ